MIRTDAYLQFKRSLKQGPLIISASYYGCSAVEYALTFGLHESGKYGDYLFGKIKTIHPSTYLYYPWGKVFYEGNKEILPSAFILPGKEYNLFIADYSVERYEEVMHALKENGDSLCFHITKIAYQASTAEALYLLKTEGKQLKK
jgi:hypothetical protein